MKTIAATEAKAKFSELLSDVERGESVRITRHGKTIAKIVPEHSRNAEEIRKAIANIRALRASLPKTGITVEDILDARHEGHKY